MKIIGTGVDIVENQRFKSLSRQNSFLKRIFTKKELFLSKKKTNKFLFFAKRFAAKEAFSKALGTGFRSGLEFKYIEIVNDEAGKPQYVKNKKIIKIVKNKFKIKNFNSFLSISDEKDYSTAFTIIQSL